MFETAKAVSPCSVSKITDLSTKKQNIRLSCSSIHFFLQSFIHKIPTITYNVMGHDEDRAESSTRSQSQKKSMNYSYIQYDNRGVERHLNLSTNGELS